MRCAQAHPPRSTCVSCPCALHACGRHLSQDATGVLKHTCFLGSICVSSARTLRFRHREGWRRASSTACLLREEHSPHPHEALVMAKSAESSGCDQHLTQLHPQLWLQL